MKRSLLITLSVLAATAAAVTLFFWIAKTLTSVPPPPAITQEYNIEVPSSTINLHIRFDIKNLADYLNRKITGTFLEKNLRLHHEKKEEIALSLSKQEPITIRSQGSQLICRFPLIVDATLIDSRFGKTLSKLVKPLHSTIIVTLSTPVHIDHKWNIVTRFKIKSCQWQEEPVLRILFFKKNIKERLEEAINDKEGELTALLDGEIYKAATLQPTLAEVWHDLQDPILLNRKPREVWIRFLCRDIKGESEVTQKNISFFTTIQAQMMILTDTTTAAKPTPLPEFRPLSKKEKSLQSDIFVYATTSFEEINRDLNNFFRGKTYSVKGYTASIKQVHAYASTSGLSVQVLTTDNHRDDNLVASGRLVFDPVTQTLKVEHFDFAISTNQLVVNSRELLLHGMIRDAIASKLMINLDTLIKRVPGIINQAVAKEKAGKVIDLTLNNFVIKKCDILMGRDKIHLVINVGTEADLKLKKIQTGKIIRIHDHHPKS